MKLLSLCIKVWVRHPGPVGGTTINRDPHPFHLVALPPSAQNLHLTAQDGCPSSCQHIHIMAHGKRSLEGSGVLLPLKCTTQKRHQKIHSHPNVQHLVKRPHLASKEGKKWNLQLSFHSPAINSFTKEEVNEYWKTSSFLCYI